MLNIHYIVVNENASIQYLETTTIGEGIIGICKNTRILKDLILRDLVFVHELERDLTRCK